MDEPLSNLDAQLRVHMRAELKRLQKDLGITTIYVTHDQVEAMTMADRVALMNKGVLQQYHGPRTLYDRPANRFVASFIGSPPINLVSCDLVDGGILDAGDFRLPLPERLAGALQEASTAEVVLGIRPQDLGGSVRMPPEGGGKFLSRSPSAPAPAEIYTTEPLGDSTILDLKIGDKLLKALVGATFEGDTGTKVVIRFPPERIHLFHRSSGR